MDVPEIMSAELAREISAGINQMGSVAPYHDISRAVERGAFHVNLYYKISEITKQNLLDKGYGIADHKPSAYYVGNEFIYHTITWE